MYVDVCIYMHVVIAKTFKKRYLMDACIVNVCVFMYFVCVDARRIWFSYPYTYVTYAHTHTHTHTHANMHRHFLQDSAEQTMSVGPLFALVGAVSLAWKRPTHAFTLIGALLLYILVFLSRANLPDNAFYHPILERFWMQPQVCTCILNHTYSPPTELAPSLHVYLPYIRVHIHTRKPHTHIYTYIHKNIHTHTQMLVVILASCGVRAVASSLSSILTHSGLFPANLSGVGGKEPYFGAVGLALSVCAISVQIGKYWPVSLCICVCNVCIVFMYVRTGSADTHTQTHAHTHSYIHAYSAEKCVPTMSLTDSHEMC